MTVHMGRCTCPAGHLLIATAVSSEGMDADTLMAQFGQCVALALRSGGIKPLCSICGARAETWRFELQEFDVSTEDAARILCEIGDEQNRIRAIARRQNSSNN